MALTEQAPISESLPGSTAIAAPFPITDELVEKFTFKLGREVIDPVPGAEPSFELRQDVSHVTREGFELPRNVHIHEMIVGDPYVAADPDAKAQMDEYVAGMEAELTRMGFDPLIERTREHPYMGVSCTDDSGRDINAFTALWLNGNDALAAWHSYARQASAVGLSFLTNPTSEGTVTSYDGVSTLPKNPEFNAHMRFVSDGIGVRIRGAALDEISRKMLGSRISDGDKPVEWLSLASGTAEPAMRAARAVLDAHGIAVNLSVVDLDKRALEYVEKNAELLGITGSVRKFPFNITSDKFPRKIRAATDRTDTQGWDIVEDTGFEEYLPQHGDPLNAHKGKKLIEVSDFKRMAWGLVDNGGALLSGNMVYPRPQARFLFGVVDWPLINARTEGGVGEGGLVDIHHKAGILNDPSAEVNLYRVVEGATKEHLYTIAMAVRHERTLR